MGGNVAFLARTSDAVAASSKATFEAAQSALKVVDSDAVKNALKAGDGAADATAQAIKRSADALSSVKVDTSAFDKAAQRAAEAASKLDALQGYFDLMFEQKKVAEAQLHAHHVTDTSADHDLV